MQNDKTVWVSGRIVCTINAYLKLYFPWFYLQEPFQLRVHAAIAARASADATTTACPVRHYYSAPRTTCLVLNNAQLQRLFQVAGHAFVVFK